MLLRLPGGPVGSHRMYIDDEHQWTLVWLGRQLAVLREDASYWRERGWSSTAAQLERIATLVEEMIRSLAAL